ncbi:phage tail sheath C-terminal domain-containing protein [Catenuloplanes indicus]|uniref:Phage tail sheath protein FI n=1 Tax=Catenuloplanes indicus TaxID=137267 RepID=A0AAE4AXI3_9ACTN|nr:phage tail sheath C-terminal domain-containing protein [Catenuloplanes indicus]MDQ0364098.1 phage tail sheath protein FI [Catenuloplanes indicus]
MAITPTYPGVYIEELPSAVRTITTVSTSVTAFVGYTTRGPAGGAITVTSFGDFERRFGGLSADSPLSYAVQQFFLNGGGIAVIVRLAPGATGSTVTLRSGGTELLTLTAREPGTWGDGLRVSVDHGATPDGFDLRISDGAGNDETHTGLTPATAADRINSTSTLVTAAPAANAPDGTRPDASGTVSDRFDAVPDPAGTEITAAVEGRDDSEITFTLLPAGATPPATLQQFALLLERGLRGNAKGRRAFSGARVRAIGDELVQVVSGEPDTVITFPDDGDLGLTGTTAPPGYAFADGAAGTTPGFGDWLGNADAKTGIHALRDADDVNLLVLPGVSALASLDEQVAVLAEARTLAETNRLFLIADAPGAWSTLDAARNGLALIDSVRGDHAALYFPHVLLTDPLTGLVRDFPPSGAVAGIMARTDGDRGVWKAPAGTEARIVGARGLTVKLTDAENGLLNPLGINCLRTFPVVGPVVWGARTLDGADRLASQWKYVPVRRTALMIEESLYRGTQWVVFEPNDETLWGQIRLNVGAFMHSLFQQGAFQGTSPRQAYLVKCDRDTTTQDDINRGVVNILVGFAPLKPAEFVIIKIEQLAGQVEV